MIACNWVKFWLITSFNNHINNDFEIDLVLNSRYHKGEIREFIYKTFLQTNFKINQSLEINLNFLDYFLDI